MRPPALLASLGERYCNPVISLATNQGYELLAWEQATLRHALVNELIVSA
ncbi:MAG: hypothetical protein Q9M16_01005 [Mariprofundus sp.]|nr:hypothetical protein [Mariprofundus sp.]